MPRRYVLPADRRTTIAVDWAIHLLIKEYASRHNMTVAEATWVLIGKALAQEEGLQWKRNDQ